MIPPQGEKDTKGKGGISPFPFYSRIFKLSNSEGVTASSAEGYFCDEQRSAMQGKLRFPYGVFSAMFLVGQVMKKSQGKANPGKVREMMIKKLKES